VIDVNELMFYWPLPVLALNVDLVGWPVAAGANSADLRYLSLNGRGDVGSGCTSHTGIKVYSSVGAIAALVACLWAKALAMGRLISGEVVASHATGRPPRD